MTASEKEVNSAQRFEFGKNWSRFLRVLDDERITEAQKSLSSMLEMESLEGKSFLDIGSGSGLFSLAAIRMGAMRVHSFDYDPLSVACARELKGRYFPNEDRWAIEQGSVLDSAFLAKLGQFDIVYAWGALHHTGNMWRALENVVPLVAQRGRLFIAIYNDQGWKSRQWRRVKLLYNKGLPFQMILAALFVPFFVMRGSGAALLRGRNPLTRFREYKKSRGMSIVHDWFDWLGGYPFEVAKPEEIFDFYRARGFSLVRLKTCRGGLGNNEFVFTKCAE